MGDSDYDDGSTPLNNSIKIDFIDAQNFIREVNKHYELDETTELTIYNYIRDIHQNNLSNKYFDSYEIFINFLHIHLAENSELYDHGVNELQISVCSFDSRNYGCVIKLSSHLTSHFQLFDISLGNVYYDYDDDEF